MPPTWLDGTRGAKVEIAGQRLGLGAIDPAAASASYHLTDPVMTQYHYTVIIEPDLDDGGFVANVPLLGLATQGETLEEVRQMAQEAIAGYLEALRQAGQQIPVESADLATQIRMEQVAVQV